MTPPRPTPPSQAAALRTSADLVTPRRTHAVPRSRTHVVRVLRTWQLPAPLVDDAALLITELATNAVRHGTGPVLRIHTRRRNHVLRCQIHDDGPANPSTPSPTRDATGLLAETDPRAESGRGLTLVGALASRWGTYTDPTLPTGSHVTWFDLLCPATMPHAPCPQPAPLPRIPEETEHAETGPANTAPVKTAPVTTDPVDTGPVNTGSVDTGPGNAGAPETHLADTGLVDTDPTETHLVETDLMDTALADTALVETAPAILRRVLAGLRHL